MLIKEFKISGLQCDTPHCNFRDDDVQFEDYPKHINISKCPLCSSILLTQSDYNRCLRYYSIVHKINVIGHRLRWFNPFYCIRRILKIEEQDKVYEGRFSKRQD